MPLCVLDDTVSAARGVDSVTHVDVDYLERGIEIFKMLASHLNKGPAVVAILDQVERDVNGPTLDKIDLAIVSLGLISGTESLVQSLQQYRSVVEQLIQDKKNPDLVNQTDLMRDDILGQIGKMRLVAR